MEHGDPQQPRAPQALAAVALQLLPLGLSPCWPEAVGNALQRDLPVNAAFALMLVFGPTLFRGRLARQRAAFLLIAWLAYVIAIAP